MNDFNIEDLPSYIERLWNNLITSQVPTDFGNVTYYGLLRDALLMVKKLAETWTQKSADFDTQIKQALDLIDSAQNLLDSINIDVQQIQADVDNALQEINNELDTGLQNILDYVKTYLASDEFNNEVDEKLNELVTDERLQTIIESLKPFHFKDVNVTDTEDKTAFDTAVNNSGALSRTSTNNDLRTMLESLIISMNIPVLGKYSGDVLRNILNVTSQTEFGNNDYPTLIQGLTFKLNTANKIYQLYKTDNQYHNIVTDEVLLSYVLNSYLQDVIDKETVYEPDLPTDCLTLGNLIDYLVLKTKGMIRVYTANHGLQTLATTDDIENYITESIVNNLTSTDTNKSLSANMGKTLNDTMQRNVQTLTQNIENINKDVLLWTGNVNGYTLNVTLSDSPYNYKWLFVEYEFSSMKHFATIPVVNGEFMYNGYSLFQYRMLDITDLEYTAETKNLKIGLALWVDQNNNTGVTITNIYGRM